MVNKNGQIKMSSAQFVQTYGQDNHKHTNQQRGAQNRQSGLDFESLITAACEHYDIKGVAKIEKTPEPTAPIKRLDGGQFIAVYTEKAQGDYKGTLRGGRAIAFEAKHTAADKINKSVVTETQSGWLRKHHALGAVCFVMASVAGSYFRVPWPVWVDMEKIYGRKHMKLTDLCQYEVPFTLCNTCKGLAPGVLFLKDINRMGETEG